MILGDRTPGLTPAVLATNTKVAARFTARVTGLFGKLAVYVDGLGGGNGTALLRGIVYAADGSLLGVSDEAQVRSGAPAGWVDLRFSTPGGCLLPATGDYDLGVLVGGTTNVARVFTKPWQAGGRRNANPYAAGPSDPFGAPTLLTTDLAVYGIAVGQYAPPDLAGEFYYARLPFLEAQKKLSETGPAPNTAHAARLAWHGTSVDPERGSFAVVQLNGVFSDWIGERVKITSWQQKGLPVKSVRCYVHNYADLQTDLSVPRRVWAWLAPPGMDALQVTVEKLT